MAGESVPTTLEEEEYFREMARARAGLAAATADADGDGAAGREPRPEEWANRTPGGRTWNVAFQPSHWRTEDAFLTLRNYVNACPDSTLCWIEDGVLYFNVQGDGS